MTAPMPMVRLTNNLVIGNFSSGHPFRFVDGSVLDACHPSRVENSKLDVLEHEETRDGGWVDISVHFELSALCAELLLYEFDRWSRGRRAGRWTSIAHIILVPLPVHQAAKRSRAAGDLIIPMENPSDHPFRVIRKASRVSGELHVDRFCV